MSWFTKIIGSITGNVAEVDAGLNVQVSTRQVNQRLGGETPAPYYVGAVRSFFEHDAGARTGEPDLRSPSVTENGNLIAAPRTLMWHEMFASASQNTGKWKYISNTMTCTQTGDGYLNMNALQATGSGNSVAMQSWKTFSLWDQSTFAVIHQITITNSHPVANQVIEWGCFIPASTPVAPTDGVYFRYDSAVGLKGYIKFGGNAEVGTGVLLAPQALTLTASYDMAYIVDERSVTFLIGGEVLGSIDIPNAQSNVFQTLSLPIAMQMRNTGAVAATNAIVKWSCTAVIQDDLTTNKPWASQMASNGFAYQGMEGGTMGQLANWANAASPAATVLTNTTAAFTGLGGIAQVTVTLAAATDGIIFSYQNPLGSATQPARQLAVHGMSLSSVVSVVLPATALVYAYAVAYGHTAVSLATAEATSFQVIAGGTTKAPRRVPLSTQGFLASAAVGTAGKDIHIQFTSPIVVNPGEFFQIIAKSLIAAPASGALVITATVDAYAE